jgi:hypothetical protein
VQVETSANRRQKIPAEATIEGYIQIAGQLAAQGQPERSESPESTSPTKQAQASDAECEGPGAGFEEQDQGPTAESDAPKITAPPTSDVAADDSAAGVAEEENATTEVAANDAAAGVAEEEKKATTAAAANDAAAGVAEEEENAATEVAADDAAAGVAEEENATTAAAAEDAAAGVAEEKNATTAVATEDAAAGVAEEENDTDRTESAGICQETTEDRTPGSEGRSRRPAVHRDRRGARRTSQPGGTPRQNPRPQFEFPPAAASLRLALHPIRHTVSLSLVLSRPEGFPERITLLLDREIEARAYDDTRYDDIDVIWCSDLLAGELRFTNADGLCWVRSARRVHIFAADPNEPDLVSVSAVRVGADHALICRFEDVPAVCAIAQQTGSPEPVAHDHWQGIPAGWSVLSGYRPAHAAGTISEAAFRPLDPGAYVDISVGGGLALRPRVFAEGHPPRIEIRPLPENVTVTIGGQLAVQNVGGGWEAPGWDAPGQHVVDVVPGPSLTYEIEPDPGNGDGWSFWNAHEELPRAGSAWSRAEICGATLQGAAGESVLACEAQSAMIALGANRGAVKLEQRSDANVSVGLMAEPPVFLIASTGLRRRQGRVIWLGQGSAGAADATDESTDLAWVDAVYSASVRRLPLVGADKAGEAAWRRAVLRARKLRRRWR